jgi:hypothetical protein
MNTLEQAVLQIAQKKLEHGEINDKIFRPRLGTGGFFEDVFFWDTAFTTMWAKYYSDVLPVEQSMENLYRLQSDDGFISRQYTPDAESKWSNKHPVAFAPPVLSWFELDFFKLKKDVERLKNVYPHLKKHHFFCMDNYQRDDGLFTGDPFGCGMDNLPRWPRGWNGDNQGLGLTHEHVHPSLHDSPWLTDEQGYFTCFSWNWQAAYIDMSAQMALNALCLKQIADILEQPADAERFTTIHQNLKDAINEKCWSDAHSFYFDLGFHQQVERFHIGAFWTLIADIVPENRLQLFVSSLTDPDKFGRPVPVPSLAFDDPDYQPEGGYWRGSSWPPTTYMVLKGLKVAGADKLAKNLAAKYCGTVAEVFDKTGTFWENLSPETLAPGKPAQPDFCGWAGLVLAIQKEIL